MVKAIEVGSFLLLSLSFFKSIDTIDCFCIFIINAHCVRSIFYRHVLVQQVYKLGALLVSHLGVGPLTAEILLFIAAGCCTLIKHGICRRSSLMVLNYERCVDLLLILIG